MAAPAIGSGGQQVAQSLMNGSEESIGELNKKIFRLRASISPIEPFHNQMNSFRISGKFAELTESRFKELLTPLIKCFLAEDEFLNYKDIFRNILELESQKDQLHAFAERLAYFLALSKASDQKKYIKQFLNIITLERIRTVSTHVFPLATFNDDLLNRIKADSLVFPLLSNYKAPRGIYKEMSTIWKICIEDIDNFLEAFSILTERPINGSDAMNFCVTYQMSMGIVAEAGGGFLAFIPFIMNALRKLYERYVQDTPSALPPLEVFTDPNFYENVAPITNRDDILREIKTAWDQRVTPILVGEPGCGKTSILIEVARRIDKGLFYNLPKGNYKAFGGSAISIASAGGMFGGNGHIERTFKKVADKRDYTILLLDEVHAFDEAQKTIIRTFFDNSPKSVRYAVFATTDQGAKEFFEKDDGSLARRFTKIKVSDLNPDETKYVLLHQARSMAPTLIIHTDVIGRIVNQANGKLSQSMKILCQVLRKALKQNTTCPSQQFYNKKVNELALVKEEHVKQIQLNQSGNQGLVSQLNQLESERLELQKKLESEHLVIKNHSLLLAKRTQLMYKIFDISQKIYKLFTKFLVAKGERLNQLTMEIEKAHFIDPQFQKNIDKLVKKYIYYNHFLNADLVKRIQEFESEHCLISLISNDYITEEDLILSD